MKYKSSLTWLIVIGFSLLIIGLLDFLGFNKIGYEGYYPQPPNKSLYGITPYAFYALGFYLVLIGLLLVLPTLDKGNRTSLKKNKLLYLILTINGLEIIFYSIFINLNLLPVLDPDHNWFGYFLVGFFVFFIGYMLVIFANDDFTELANYRNRLSFIVSFGVLIIIISLFTYWGLMRAFTISPNEWPPILMCGVLFLIIGGSPLLITRLANNKSLSKTFSWISFVITGIGIITYLAPTLALNDVLFPMSIFTYNDYYDYLVFGMVLIMMGLPNLLFSEYQPVKRVKESFIFIIMLVLSIIHFFVSVLLLLTDTYFIETGLKAILVQMNYKSLILGMPWTVWYINGFLLLIISLLGIHSFVLKETVKLDNQVEENN